MRKRCKRLRNKLLYGAFLVIVGIAGFIALKMLKDVWTYTIIKETIEIIKQRQEPKSVPIGDVEIHHSYLTFRHRDKFT